MSHSQIYEKIAEAISQNIAATLVTVVKVERSVPQELGAKMLVYPDGSIAGTIGGGELEFNVIKNIVATRPTAPTLREFTLLPAKDKSAPESLSMVCGGVMHVLVEPLLSANRLVIAGGGHCAIALTKIAKMLDFHVTIYDCREEWANKTKNPLADVLIHAPYTEIDTHFQENLENTYLVIMTHAHSEDEICLTKMIDKKLKYCGSIGSKAKITNIFNKLKAAGTSEDVLKEVFAPIGFSLGTKIPEEVAISIMAQILAVKNNMREELCFSSNPLLKNPH